MSKKDLHTEIESLKSEIKRLRKTLNELTPSLSAILKGRGFKVHKKEPLDDLLVPEKIFIDGYYEMLKRYSFRLFLRDVIKHQPLFTLQQATRYAKKEITGEYISYLVKTGLVASENNVYRLKKALLRALEKPLSGLLQRHSKGNLPQMYCMCMEGNLPKTVLHEGRTEMCRVCKGCYDKRGA